MLKQISKELKRHVPFTMLGAVTGIIIMVVIVFSHASRGISDVLFYTLHPLHVVFSALVTTAMYKLYGRGKLWAAILIGYTGSIGIATLSDAIIPYLGGGLLNVPMEFHAPFIETAKMPFIGIAKW
ncbi:hypothetical protein KKC91_00565, partial [bacterium]|nr:hypothetical protein [bacterium]